ncbi:MAG: isoleucine--tRNA ligase [Candidatus Moranbacteria bacterium]|nr:isoleucine--tRNA ligase [Candidatus Moranbacteria bacterium]MBP9801388.1 isoleucine--tRNA ligase [Candidatus Moranbacteria bacterium]
MKSIFKKVEAQANFPKMEEEILKYWEMENIFEKSVAGREGKPRYSFNDGPPFATGTPHYGHIVASVIKDAVPRYFTMRGFQVERKWGWDCHGLPIENIAEKALGIKHKKDIEALGVAKFNEFCRGTVLEYAAEWEKVMPRIGRWADMRHAYRTMDKEYMESVWWVFKTLWDKGLIYESYRSMHICPRCETTLSQQEVSDNYIDVKDLSVTAKFELADEPGTFILAWTTTPWTLPGNVALAVGSEIEYLRVKFDSKEEHTESSSDYSVDKKKTIEPGIYIFAKKRYLDFEELFDPADYTKFLNGTIQIEDISNVKGVISGRDLVGQRYKPLFNTYANDTTLENHERGWKIYVADFVNTDEGTGVVHIAPAFGEDDMELGRKESLPFVQHVRMDGTMKDEVTEFAGMDISPRAKGKVEEIRESDLTIVKYLTGKGLVFTSEKYLHSYPHCWRCDTPLLNYATSSWFVAVTKIKEKSLELAKQIYWSPEHIKEGRFGKWLSGARDWSISRQRYWASVMPIWKCECEELRVFGSVADLERASGKKITDLHKHIVDDIVVPCEKCGETMHRIPDVLDTWFDSGSMPYAQEHYPFENAGHFQSGFPVDFIAEGVDQTRAWFYYQHILGTAVQESVAFKHVIVNGIVLAEDGKKMSKRLKNYPDPMEVVQRHGADALRLYLLSSPIVAGENLNFSERDLTESSRNVFRMLWNSYSFFVMYAVIDEWSPKENIKPSEHVLDRWMLSELQILIRSVDQAMESYELARATRLFAPFIDQLSNWYIRRSRDRFWKSENDTDKEHAYQTLYDVLVTLSQLMAPFTPFLAEELYRNLTGKPSVHLSDWPVVAEKLVDEKLNEDMSLLREVVTLGLQKRAEKNMKVRQPLAKVLLPHKYGGLFDEAKWRAILCEELNVHGTELRDTEDVDFDWALTDDLKLEGEMNEINRAIQEGRKKAGFHVEDRIVLGYQGKANVFEKFQTEIARKVLAETVTPGDVANAEYIATIDIEGEPFTFQLKRV